MQEKSQKLLFVINPVSGGKEKHDREAEIREYFSQLPHSICFYILCGKSDEVSIEHHIETFQPDKVVAVGGDGTVKLVAELLKHTPRVLGIIPAGSANGMAKELNIPQDLEEALDVVVYGQCQTIDAIAVNDTELCLHLSDMGLNALLIKNFASSGIRGKWGYAKSIFKVLIKKQKIYATITTDEGTVKRKAYMIVLANARKYGTGATINPEGSIHDGHFEVVVVRRLNIFSLFKMLITHQTFDERVIEIFSTRKLELSSLKKSYFQVDGEYRGRLREIKAEIVAGCIRVAMPVEKEKKTNGIEALKDLVS